MVTTVIELSATDRQANDDIIARLDSLIVAAASQETLLAAIAGADSLIVHLKRTLFENPNEVDRQRLRFMEAKYEALIDEAHIDES